MRIKWMLAGMGGLSAATASASATLNWQTVLGPNSNIGGGTVANIDAVVTSPTGDVGVITQLADSSYDVLYIPNSNLNSPPVTVVDTTGSGVFNHLAITSNASSGTRLTFVDNEGENNVGVLQYDVPGSGLQPVALSNQTFNGTTLVMNSSLTGDGTLALQVNQAGQAFFASGTTSPTTNVLVSGNASSSPTATIEFTDGNDSLTLSSVSNRVGIGTGTGVATLSNGGALGIYAVGGGNANLLSGTYTHVSLLGTASGTAGANASIFLANDPTSSAERDVVLNQGGTLSSAGTNTIIFTGPSGGGSPAYATAEITPDGKQIAAYIPDSNGGTLQYYNAGAVTPAAVTIASTSSANSLTHSFAYDPATQTTDPIASLQTFINAPMINSNGIVVFDATVDTAAFPGGTQALLEWQANDANPIILLAAGDTVDIDGAGPQIIEGFDINSLDTENDFFKNSLSDGNYLAVNVFYDSGQAVIMTNLNAIPEPTTVCMIPLAGAALLVRRRRRNGRTQA